MKVLLRGPLLTNSGYGVHARQIFEVLERQKDIDLSVQCTGWGKCSWLVDPDGFGGLVERIMRMSKPIDDTKFDLSVQVQLPDEWDPKLGKKNIGVTAAVETNKCSSAWVEQCNKMDKIIVPSTFTKNVIKRSGIIYKTIEVIPEWFNQSLLDKPGCDKIHYNDERYRLDNQFNFLVMGLVTGVEPSCDRKNLINTVKWLMEEFEGEKEVGILLKTSFGKSTKLDQKITIDFIKSAIDNFRKGSFPKVHLIHGNLSEKEIASLYYAQNVKAFVSATRGEGYGLPVIDAAAAGLPIAITDWSGHYEYLDRDLITPISYELVDIPKEKIDGRVFIEGVKWANPQKESFKESVRSIYENYKSHKENAKILQKTILSNYNKVEIAKKYQKVIFG